MKSKSLLTGTEDLASYSDTQFQLNQLLEDRGTLADAIDSTLAHWASLRVPSSLTTVTGEQDTAELLEVDITDYYIRCKGVETNPRHSAHGSAPRAGIGACIDLV